MLKKDSVFIVTKQNLYDAGDAIREKTGDSDPIPIKDMDDAIDSIETGITPSGTIQIAQNGQGIDVAQYANADVSVPNTYTQADEGKVVDNGSLVAQTAKPDIITLNNTYDTTKYNSVTVNTPSTNKEAEIISGTLSGDYTGSATLLKSRIFINNTTLTGIHFPNCLEVEPQACLIDNTTMKSILSIIDLPIATNIGFSSFARVGNGLSNGTYLVVNIPSAVQLGMSAFESCKKIKKIDLPACTSLGDSALAICESLDQIDLGYVGSTVVSIGARCMAYSPITSLILRNTLGAATLANTAALTGTNIAAGTGYIYVPAALKSTYEAATNWSAFASQFRALEDYTVDGTTTGALDPTKV